MRKVLTLLIVSVFVFLMIKFDTLGNFLDFKEVKIRLSELTFFKKKITKVSVMNNKNTSKNYLLRLLNIDYNNEL